MFSVNVGKPCGCFKKSKIENNKTFDSKEAAKEHADVIMNHMEHKSCGKHHYELQDKGEEYFFEVTINRPPQQ